MQSKKPRKKSNKELWELISKKIEGVEYIFKTHAKQRQYERKINDLTVINILENMGNSRRKRNKGKDKYELGFRDWNYCIEGYDHNNNKTRIIISFDADFMLIITVIHI